MLPMPGAPVQVEELSDAHHNVVQFAVAELLNSAKTGNAFLGMKFLRVESMSTQVVAGSLHKFNVILGKEDDASVEKVCEMEVWEKPWENFREVQWDKFKCDGEAMEINESGIICGGPEMVVDLTPNQEAIVDFGFSQLAGLGDKFAGIEKINVEKFTTQVVAGTLYKFHLSVKHEDVEKICEMVIWDKPWENFREVQWDQVKWDGQAIEMP